MLSFVPQPNMKAIFCYQRNATKWPKMELSSIADYFLGPYGSYASVEAAKAGLGAVEPARSLMSGGDNGSSKKKNNKGGTEVEQTTTKQNRQGVLNLFTLLSARYTSIEEKQQLAILFSLISKKCFFSLKFICQRKGQV